MRSSTAALIALAFAPLSAASTQEVPLFAPGARIRVTYNCSSAPVYSRGGRTDCQETEATLTAMTGDSMTLTTDDPITRIVLPRESVIQLSVRRGRKSNVGPGALMGFVTGAVVGGVVGATEGEGHMVSAEGAVATWGLGLGAVGAIVGGISGAFIKTDRWEEVPLERVRISFTTQRGRFAVGMRIGR